jgi:hypothetical protein
MYQMIICTYNIPNIHKIFQMILKYTNIFQSKALQKLPKIGIIGLKINHLATLSRNGSDRQLSIITPFHLIYWFLRAKNCLKIVFSAYVETEARSFSFFYKCVAHYRWPVLKKNVGNECSIIFSDVFARWRIMYVALLLESIFTYGCRCLPTYTVNGSFSD